MRTHTDLATRIRELGWRLEEDGLAPHERALAELAGRAVASGIAPGAVAALVDPNAPAIVRQRAFAVIARALEGTAPHDGAALLLDDVA